MKLGVAQHNAVVRKQGTAIQHARASPCYTPTNHFRHIVAGNPRLRTSVVVNAAEVSSTCAPSAADEPYILLSTDPVELLAEINRLRQENVALRQALVENNLPVEHALARAAQKDNHRALEGHLDRHHGATAGLVTAPASRRSPQQPTANPDKSAGPVDALITDSRVKRSAPAPPRPRTSPPTAPPRQGANGVNGVNGANGAATTKPPAVPGKPAAKAMSAPPSISDIKAAAAAPPAPAAPTTQPRMRPATRTPPPAKPTPPGTSAPRPIPAATPAATSPASPRPATGAPKPIAPANPAATAPASPRAAPVRKSAVSTAAAARVTEAPKAFVTEPVKAPVKAPTPTPTPKAPVQKPGVVKEAAAVSAPAKPAKAPEPEPTQEQLDRLRGRKMNQVDFPLETDDPMDIVFVSAEVAPWSKTGGLGDVAGSLPIGLAARGHRVMVIAPRYQHGSKSDVLYDCAFDAQCRITVDMGGAGYHEVALFHCHKDNVDWVFIDHPVYHRPGTPYCDGDGMAFEDNQFRYALLSLAACEVPLQLHVGGFRSGTPPGFPYGDNCVFVANDWHAGLVPVYIASRYRPHGVYRNARTIFAIHNLSHQGVEPSETYGNLGLPENWYEPVSWRFPDWARITGPAVNILKGGVVCSDRLVTVSQGYAWEVTTPEGGWGLHELLTSKSHVLNGITNGIDMEEWNPATDTFIEANYSALDLKGKAKCKMALQEALGLEVNPDIPLLGFIGRLDFQKGPDVVLDAVQQLAERGVQVVMLGSGMPDYEAAMRQNEASFSRNFRGWVGFSVPVAHQIIAGSDILLMPSRFEPCGLNQLFAMRYGTIPIAHATGGLRDTIQDFNAFAEDPTQMGTGWTFGPPEVGPMLRCLDSALKVYHEDKDTWQEVQLNGMCADLSWARSAHQYEQIFKWARIDNPLCNGW